MQLGSADIDATDAGVAALQITLLGGFRVEREGTPVSDVAWHRRSAKGLTKLLATHPAHALHREQVFDILWPHADVASARNSLAKALHAARHALEPGRRPREQASCIRLRDEMVVLDRAQVLVDADGFQQHAQAALRLGTVAAYEAALAAYTGLLLPEDLYEDWASERRRQLADLNVRLLIGLAETLETHGAHGLAVERLHAAMHEDPLREDVHRRLMRLYSATGERGLALRQFEICRDVLDRELHVAPDHETTQLYEDLLANRIERRGASADLNVVPIRARGFDGAVTPDGAPTTPFVGREPMLQFLTETLSRAEAGSGDLVVISGEAGVGKTRLVARFALDAQRMGACVLGDARHTSSFPYGPFAAAVEAYVAVRPEAERAELARRYPALACLIPSVESPTPLSLVTDGSDATSVRLGTEIARLLTDVAEAQPVVLIIGDLDEAHPSTLRLLEYLANLVRQHRWLVIATLRDEAMVPGSGALRMLSLMTYERLCVHVRLHRLGRHECDHLLRTLLCGHVQTADLVDRIYSLTGGNPFFVEEIARHMRDREVPPSADWCSDDLPREAFRVRATARAVLEKAIAPLGPNVRRVLELAAVAGSQVALDDLRCAAAELEPPLTNVDLFDALDRVLSSRILMESRDGYTIRHALVREALLQDLPQHRRAQLTAAFAHVSPERGAEARARAVPRVETPEPELG